MRKRAIKVLLLVLAIIIASTIIFGFVDTEQFSAYGACRREVMKHKPKGYGGWKHKSTLQMGFVSDISFYDGGNYLGCRAVGIGPFWTAQLGFQTMLGCLRDANGVSPCPEGYFGVSP